MLTSERKLALISLAMTLQLGLRNLMLHKLRSFLTMLGTVLGVASVIAMLAIGEGSKEESIKEIRKLGTNNVIIRTVKPPQQLPPPPANDGSQIQAEAPTTRTFEYGLTHYDYDRLQRTLPHVDVSVAIALSRKTARNGRRELLNSRILGTTAEYQAIKRLKLLRGRFISPTDLARTANVAVLASGAAARLFGYQDPLGKTVLLGEGAFRIVGVLKTQSSGTARAGAIGQDDFNNDIYIPLTAVQRRIGELQQVGSLEYEHVELHEVTFAMNHEKFVEPTADMARKLLKQTHNDTVDFEIQVPLELLHQAERERQIWNLVLGSIAGISLLVGGIGIMNIMLATVTERTREIGIRRALGARRSDIVLQFLVESTALSAIGGLIGIMIGVLIPVSVTYLAEIQTSLKFTPVILSFVVAVLTGVVFGVYPASRAAAMSPIEALRHE